jgi:hypothetical protein
MKYFYLVDYWVPFPSSEYGGVVSVIAENDQECHDLLRDSDEFDERYQQKIMERVVNAHKFALANEEESRVVDSFTT